MRPTRLELQGFASFREHTVVDLAGADLFVLCGPTGAGKSSLIDAMTFALYGSVARYGTKLVGPVVSQGGVEARVLLDFSVDGATYRVARVARRTKGGGASTKEARLELLPAVAGGDTVDLAIGAREVTAAVEDLLGLTFEHFTRTVVLPQGAFQDFLHATAGDRQELLVQLLDLGVYKDIASRARSRAEAGSAQVQALSEQLESVAGVSDEAIATVATRLDALGALADQVDAAQPELDEIRERGAALRSAQTKVQADLDRLDGIHRPAGLDDLAERLQVADSALAAAAGGSEAATTAREAAEDELRGLPSARDLAAVLAALSSVQRSADQVDAAVADHAQLQAAAELAGKQADQAVADASDADAGLRAAETAHGVHALRVHLVAGAPCPLCEQPVAMLPEARAPEDLTAARSRAEQATSEAARATRAAAAADAAVLAAAEQVTSRRQLHDEQVDALAGLREAAKVPDDADADAVASLHAAAVERESGLEGLRTAERTARAAVVAARDHAATLDGERSAAMTAIRDAHARVADLGAPPPGDDLADAWSKLMDWVAAERPRRAEALEAADRQVAEAIAAWSQRNQLVLDACTAAGVAVQASGAVAGVATARAEAAGQLEGLRQKQAQAAELTARVAERREQAEVAATLGRVLHANNFQKWLLARGLTRLVIGASSILADLSNGAYSLELGDDNAFLVADHRNAGEQRHARSLSGGETFLASLALALSLAEHVADLAARGSARLESLFLDEGFGTLDADTLDIVASCLEELGATGRMVGVITHVPELAQRLPVRFEVHKGPGGSQVERFDA